MRTSVRHTDQHAPEFRWGLRKISVQTDQVLSEYGTAAGTPWTRVTAAAVIQNPWVGLPVDTDLQTPARDIAPRLAKLLTDRILDVVGDAHKVEAFGKGAIIGTAGELEHGAALVHTPYFANLVREFLEGDTVIAFADDRGEAGTSLVVPLGRKNAGPTRNHFQTATVRVSDAPRPNELVLIVAASTGTRPFPRSGDRTTDPIVLAKDLEGAFL
ncbi:amino acid synthesis family protein [Paenarthrobacter ureafaciens]|uniref:amino acid synthesis family protein n=1 Tax=Paenarthrobacter ureafaciens TaxID=37931 RepID=UPI0014075E81|nr:amino acid synthesis family protein [Paenarthrobacter ureafaciens]MCX8453605.1 amino acid synthesis family protein [Paenarthrobacter ureafaciens]MCY0973264.1 amino acid synthesis family protein [Paenarthrobacter ureafaciens]